MRARPESFCCTHITTFFEDVEVGKGTGFLYRFGQSLALVSNRHVLSGRNPLTGTLPPGVVFTPNRVEFHVSVRNEQGYFLRPMSLPLLEEGDPLWKEIEGYRDEKDRMHLVDIAILPLDNVGLDDRAVRSDIAAFAAHMIVKQDIKTGEQSIAHGYPRVGNEVFILGYPKGLTEQGVIPVWKRGSVASEPLFNIMGGVPAFFVDGLTRDGMSGSAVLSFTGEITDEHGETLDDADLRHRDPWLLGVYAGRNGVTLEELNMTLGRVWYRKLLDDIFFNGIAGRTEVDPSFFDFS